MTMLLKFFGFVKSVISMFCLLMFYFEYGVMIDDLV